MGGRRTVQSAQHFGGNANDMSLIWEDIGEELGSERDAFWRTVAKSI